MKILLIYLIVSVIYEGITFIISWKQFKKKLDGTPQLQMLKMMFSATASMENLKKKFLNWYTIGFVGVPFLIIISPFLFPYTLFGHLRRLIFGKTKLEKRAEEEQKQYDEARKRSEDFMRNEGRQPNVETSTYINFKDNEFIKRMIDDKDEPIKE